MAHSSRQLRGGTIVALTVGLPALSVLILWVERRTHIEFLLHVAAIPLEILIGAFLFERWLARSERDVRRRQLMYLKSYLFRAEMRALFVSNFTSLTKPALPLQWIRDASVEELTRARDGITTLEYRSPAAMEEILSQYVRARHAFQVFMEWAAEHDFESIFHDMIFVLNFIQDFQIFKRERPGVLFVEHAQGHPRLLARVDKILLDGVVKFLDYAIELRCKEPEVLEELLDDYLLSSKLRAETGEASGEGI